MLEKYFQLVFNIEFFLKKNYHLGYEEEKHTLIHTPNFNMI